MIVRRILLFVILSCLVIGCDEPDLGRFSSIERRVSQLGTWGISTTAFGVEKARKEKKSQFLYQLIYVFERNPGRITENIRDGSTVTVEGRDFIADEITGAEAGEVATARFRVPLIGAADGPAVAGRVVGVQGNSLHQCIWHGHR